MQLESCVMNNGPFPKPCSPALGYYMPQQTALYILTLSVLSPYVWRLQMLRHSSAITLQNNLATTCHTSLWLIHQLTPRVEFSRQTIKKAADERPGPITLNGWYITSSCNNAPFYLPYGDNLTAALTALQQMGKHCGESYGTDRSVMLTTLRGCVYLETAVLWAKC